MPARAVRLYLERSVPDDTPAQPDAAARPERELIAAAAAEAFEGAAGSGDDSGTGRLGGAGALLATLPGFELLREVRGGGQGVVYEALQQSTRRRVAIKVLRQGPFATRRDQARFEQEVHILAALEHPSIVAVHDSGEAAGCFYYVMDYVDGLPLDHHVRAHDLPLRARLRLFAEVCEAVDAAHLRGVIHRDLKPGNILVDGGGRPRVLDFGLAKRIDSSSAGHELTLTQSGQFVGSLPWAAPEQADGGGRIDLRTDVYALGVILYQLLTGRFPYDVTGRLRDVLARITTAEPQRPRTLNRAINDEVETIVLQCLRKEPERRYQSAGALARDLRRYLAGEAIDAKRDSAAYVIRKQLARHRVPTAFAATLALVVLVSLVLIVGQWRRALDEQQKSVAVVDFLQQLLVQVDPDAAGRDVTLREALDDAVARLDAGAFEHRPLVEAELRRTLGVAYQSLGSAATLAAAEAQLRRAQQLFAAHAGPDARATADAGYWLAGVLVDLAHYDEAEPLLEHALAVHARRGGRDDPQALDARNSLAVVYRNQGRLDLAAPLLRDVLDHRIETLGPDDPATLTTSGNLAAVHYHLGRAAAAAGDAHEAAQQFEQAAALHRAVYASRARVLGERAPQTVISLNNLGGTLTLLGRCDEAEPLLRDALQRARDVWGDEHLYTLLVRWYLGRCRVCRESYDDAVADLRPAFDAFLERRGPADAWTTESGENLIAAYEGLGQAGDAEAVRALLRPAP